MKQQSMYAWICLAVWVAITAIMFFMVASHPASQWPPKNWDARSDTLFWGLVVLIASAPFLMGLDPGKGLVGIYYSEPKSRMNHNDDAVSGTLSVLSIRAAITAGILGALINYQDRILGSSGFVRPLTLKLLDAPLAAIFAVVTLVLLISILTTLVSSLCYEYSIKIDWSNKPNMKWKLRQKAHWLGVVGFYALMWSLAAITAFVDAYICVATMFGIFFIMWLFYFFPENIVSAEITTNTPNKVNANSSTLSGTIQPKDPSSSAFFEWGTSTEYKNRALVNHIAFESNINGLMPNTTYHVRFVAGDNKGKDISFTTHES